MILFSVLLLIDWLDFRIPSSAFSTLKKKKVYYDKLISPSISRGYRTKQIIFHEESDRPAPHPEDDPSASVQLGQTDTPPTYHPTLTEAITASDPEQDRAIEGDDRNVINFASGVRAVPRRNPAAFMFFMY